MTLLKKLIVKKKALLDKLNATLPQLNSYKILLLYYLLGVFGALFAAVFFYYRFLQYRLPKKIPFDLNEWWLIVLIAICLTYLYLILRVVKPKNPPRIIVKFLQVLIVPLATFFHIAMNNRATKPYYTKALNFLLCTSTSWVSVSWNIKYVLESVTKSTVSVNLNNRYIYLPKITDILLFFVFKFFSFSL